jgi:hypothetical protein
VDGQVEGQTDRQTDMVELIVAFCSFADMPKNSRIVSFAADCQLGSSRI